MDKDAHGEIVRKAGVMGVVVAGGVVRPGQGIETTLPPLPHKRLERVGLTSTRTRRVPGILSL